MMPERQDYAAELDLVRTAHNLLDRAAEDGVFTSLATRERGLRYGENGHQVPASLYTLDGDNDPLAIGKFDVVRGDPGYVNLTDVSDTVTTARYLAAAIDENYAERTYIALGVKHGNACGAAESDDKNKAVIRMLEGDLRAIFGGCIMTNFEIDEEVALLLSTHKVPQGEPSRKFDVVIAPSITEEALSLLARKKDALKAFTNPALASLDRSTVPSGHKLRQVLGGLLVQPHSSFIPNFASGSVMKNHEAVRHIERAMLLAWAVGSTSTSNTITLVNAAEQMLIGNGVGQQDRVSAAQLALKRAAEAGHYRGAYVVTSDNSNVLPRIIYEMPKDTVAYSDSFFPFTDGPLQLAEAGVSAVFGVHGSVKDREVQESFSKSSMTFYSVDAKDGRGFAKH